MHIYEELRKNIHRCMVPLPMLYRQDLSIDHAGLERRVAWLLDAGIKNLCLTFTYSTIDSVTTEELVDVTRTIANVVGDRAVFISCTGGGPYMAAIETVNGMQKTGAHAVFVHMPEFVLQNQNTGELYVNYLRTVAQETDMAILCCALPNPWTTTTPMLTEEHYEQLVEQENFIGLKDDFYSLPDRAGLSRRFGDRLCIIGGGILRHYVFFHRLPCQGEFAGIFNSSRGLRFFELLDEDRYAEALQMIDDDECEHAAMSAVKVHWIARNQVCYYAMGFAETYLVRPPLVPATEDQARDIIENMHAHPALFDHVVR